MNRWSWISPVLKDALGRRVEQVSYLAHSYEGRITSVIAIRMIFPCGLGITIRPGSDGESLLITSDALGEADLGSAGSMHVLETLQIDPAKLSSLLGRPLDMITVGHDRDHRLRFISLRGGGHDVFIAVVGDEMCFDRSIFDEAREGQEEITAVPYFAPGGQP